MSEWDKVARYQPVVAPRDIEQSREMRLKRPYVVYWMNSTGEFVPLSPRGFHLRKTALAFVRQQMLDNSSPSENHHTRYYIRDTSWAREWQPANPYCWTPVAERPRDQWVPSYIPTPPSV